jgi:hypothetical protein
MKNTLVLSAGLLLSVAIVIATSCQKEINFPTNNGRFVSGWSFTHSNIEYEGCVTSANYETTNNIKLLSIKGHDGLGSFISLMIPAPGGILTAGTTYTAAQGAVLIVEDKNGNTYRSTSAATSFSFKTVAVTDTSVIATFKASLTDTANTGYVISSGSVSALLGRTNNCIVNGNTNGTAGYSLISSSSGCIDVYVEGDYTKGTPLTSENKITIQVNVTKIGTWSLTTATTNGMKFSGSGTFNRTGVQTIILRGKGIPENVGNTVFPIVGNTTTCNFYITVID